MRQLSAVAPYAFPNTIQSAGSLYASAVIIIIIIIIYLWAEWSPVHCYLLTPWPLVRERTIPTEGPPLVDEI
jgi:hypothetical protein